MTIIVCPSCGERGSIPSQLLGKRVKCQKCGQGFATGPSPVASHAAPAAGTPESDAIEVDGLDAATWASTAVAVAVAEAERHHAPEPEHHPILDLAHAHPDPGPEPAAVASPARDGPVREYKVLTQKDRWFGGKFELARLEEALNHYAREGWVVRAMATPHVTGFSGGPREELVVLMER